MSLWSEKMVALLESSRAASEVYHPSLRLLSQTSRREIPCLSPWPVASQLTALREGDSSTASRSASPSAGSAARCLVQNEDSFTMSLANMQVG